MDTYKNAKYALIIAVAPAEGANNPLWRRFVEQCRRVLPQGEKSTQMNEGTWMIQLSSNIRLLNWIFEVSLETKIVCRVLFLVEPPDWLEIG